MKLSPITSDELDEAGKYYHDGFALLNIGGKSKDEVVHSLNELLFLDKIKGNFSWEQRENSFHLRPDVFSYDNCFLDLLFDNKLYNLLELYTCKRLTLSHIQVVKTAPGRSYQDWHRDTHQNGINHWAGNTPPAHKIIFYPMVDHPEPRLKFIRSSHRCYANNQAFDNNLINSIENEILFSNNDQVMLFDTSMLHGVIPDVHPRGSIRLIYNFITENQYLRKYASKEHHKVLHDLYEKRLKDLK
jgi:hypothetical protein